MTDSNAHGRLGAGRPSWVQRWQSILQNLQLVPDAQAEAALLQQLAGTAARATRPHVLAFVNAHALNLAARDFPFALQLAQADVLLRDGAGLAMLLRWCGFSPGRNLNGTDFIPRLLSACNGQSLAVLGTSEPHLQRGTAAITAQLMPRSSLVALDGFQDTKSYIAMLRVHRPQCVLLAMGMPRQEALAAELRDALDLPCLVICGGAIVDFLGGRVRRAPGWLRRLGLEWLWRLAQEPRRLFMRYVVGNPMFLWRSARLSRQMRSVRPTLR